MYRTVFKLWGTDTEVVIEESDRDVFKRRVASFIGPNSGWYNNDFGTYIDRFFDQDIDACRKTHRPK